MHKYTHSQQNMGSLVKVFDVCSEYTHKQPAPLHKKMKNMSQCEWFHFSNLHVNHPQRVREASHSVPALHYLTWTTWAELKPESIAKRGRKRCENLTWRKTAKAKTQLYWISLLETWRTTDTGTRNAQQWCRVFTSTDTNQHVHTHFSATGAFFPEDMVDLVVFSSCFGPCGHSHTPVWRAQAPREEFFLQVSGGNSPSRLRIEDEGVKTRAGSECGSVLDSIYCSIWQKWVWDARTLSFDSSSVLTTESLIAGL